MKLLKKLFKRAESAEGKLSLWERFMALIGFFFGSAKMIALTTFLGSVGTAFWGYFTQAYNFFGPPLLIIVFLSSAALFLWIAKSFHGLKREKTYKHRHSYILTKLRDGELFFDYVNLRNGNKKRAKERFDYIISLLPAEPWGQPSFPTAIRVAGRKDEKGVCLYGASKLCFEYANKKGIAYSDLSDDENLLYWYYRLRQEIIRTTVVAFASRTRSENIKQINGYEMQYLIPEVPLEEKKGKLKLIHDHDAEKFTSPPYFKVSPRYKITLDHALLCQKINDIVTLNA